MQLTTLAVGSIGGGNAGAGGNDTSDQSERHAPADGVILVALGGPDGEGAGDGGDARGGDGDGGAGEGALGGGKRGALEDHPGGHSCGARHGYCSIGQARASTVGEEEKKSAPAGAAAAAISARGGSAGDV